MELTIGNRRWPLDADVSEMLVGAARVWETPNDTLRRLLSEGAFVEEAGGTRSVASAGRAPVRRRRPRRGDVKRSEPKRPRAKAGTILPESEYDQPILEALIAGGGRAAKSEVLAVVGRSLSDRFLPADREMMGNEERWQKRAQFRRLKLVQQGLIRSDSPRGVWEITDSGRAAVDERQRAA
jgi:hypothetical protein